MPDYPSNISRAQFALIQPDLENFRKHTRPRRYDLYDVFNAILYSLTTGCQWRELPHDRFLVAAEAKELGIIPDDVPEFDNTQDLKDFLDN
ncbi:hypothetical protein B8W93_10425 [Lentilactobacillus kefiri]|nr:hypothetical protein B8W85_10510 [Lentilactobacillus kefiri]PAL05361.1 hypothetical protein B8W93_10425 [Lentilactobacillus kefiri]